MVINKTYSVENKQGIFEEEHIFISSLFFKVEHPDINNKLIKSSWNDALEKINNKIKNINPNNIQSLSGNLTDVETLMSAKIFLESLGSKNYECRIDNVKIDPSNRCSYIFTETYKQCCRN